MGVSKVILVDPNTQTPEVLMDVTGDDTSAGVLLAGNVGTRNDGEKVTGNIPEKTSSDLTVSGATVTAPAGHYASSASATVASGTAGTPTATKGSVSNHSVNVTPSVTNTSGYISGGTQTGTPVSVSASELVSGTKSISANGTGIDVTNYAAVDVDVATEMPGLDNALCFSSPSSFTLQIGTNGLTAAQVWNHMEWTDAATPQSVWATWDGSTTLTATNGKLYLRGTGNTSVTGYDFMRSIFITFQFTGADIECSGNIETLLDYETVAQGNHPTMDAGCYGYLFFNSPITTAPSLPATTLTDYCYYYMFCRTALTSAPSLPATTLATSCYSNMFYGCAALTSAPSLPATTLATSCYERMFYNCTALTSAPALPATTLSNRCYCYMFNGCTALTSAPALPATTLTTYCYSNMFHDCTALTSAPVLPATTLANYCYYSMFYGCTALTSAPELPATTLTTCCYQSMFYGCIALTSAPSLPATTLATYCYQSMFRGCTALTSVPVLPATTLANYCYNNMFYGCSSIKLSTAYDPTNYPYAFRIPESGTGVDATGSFNGMFTGTGGSFADTPTINTVYYLDKPLPVDFTVDGDATASDILPGKISYANGSRVVGNMASKSSSDLTFAENRTTGTPTVTAPAGYYDEDATKVISMGTITGPTITKGTVSNHTMPLTASIVNTGGYFYPATTTTSGTSVSASELVSGTKSISANGTGIDVTNYATVDVAVAGGSPVAGLTNALEFRSPSSFKIKINNKTRAYWDGIIEWTDGIQSWATWDGITELTASDGVLYLRGTNNTQVSGDNSFGGFKLTGSNISCNGNIETLLDYATVARGEHPAMAAHCYHNLFKNCTALVSAPTLPAIELTENCYQSMFYGCSSLGSAPALPATTAAKQCYSQMFYGCSSLTSAPTISATTLALSCFGSMFYYCTALTSAPALPATTLEQMCYHGMFFGCTALTSAPALPAMTMADRCYQNMFMGCTSLVSAPALPATTLNGSCYYAMFRGCTALTYAPDLPATTVAYDGYYQSTQCYAYMFYGCTALTSPPVISLTNLSNYCFDQMFYGCTSLTSIPALPVATLKDGCYRKMFYGCTSLKVSETYDATNYPYTLRIPKTGTGTAGTSSLDDMFTNTGGSFTGTPSINTNYYTENPLVEATA